MVYIQNLSVDFNAAVKPPCIHAKQHDCGSRFLQIRLLADGQPLLCENVEIVLKCEKADGSIIFNAVTVLGENLIQCPLTSALLSCAGLVRCEITLYDSGSVLSSGCFFIHVMPSIDDTTIEGSNEFTELQKIMAEYAEQMKNAVTRQESVCALNMTALEISVKEAEYEEVNNV